MTKKPSNTATKYEVFHPSYDFFPMALHYRMFNLKPSDLAEAFRHGDYSLAGTVEVPSDEAEDALGYVFYHSQNLEKDWNPKAKSRSTSVGDIIKTGDDYYIVAPVGFDRMPNPNAIKTSKK